MPSITLYQNQYVVLKTYSNEKITFWDSEFGVVTEDLNHFKQQWGGLAILMQTTPSSEEVDYKNTHRKQYLNKTEQLIWVSIGLILLGCCLLAASSFYEFLAVLFLGAGVVVSGLLLQNEYGKPAVWVQQICHVGQNSSCMAVTNSSAGKLFNWLSWSEIGVVFFLGSLLSQGLSKLSYNPLITQNISIYLFYIHLLASPYAIFSVYYQRFVIRQWCVLCLVVQAVLIGALLSEWQYASFNLSFDEKSFIVLSIGFGLPIIGWLIIKPLLQLQSQNRSIEKRWMSFRRNSYLFSYWLKQQNSVNENIHENDISIGNPEAPVTILMVADPTCDPCAWAYRELKPWMNYFSDEVRFIIRFIAKNEEHSIIIKHLLSIRNRVDIIEVISKWYELRIYEDWKQDFPIFPNTDIDIIYEAQQQWAVDNNIQRTPSVFVNGKELNLPFMLTDLKFHIRFLAEEAIETTIQKL